MSRVRVTLVVAPSTAPTGDEVDGVDLTPSGSVCDAYQVGCTFVSVSLENCTLVPVCVDAVSMYTCAAPSSRVAGLRAKGKRGCGERAKSGSTDPRDRLGMLRRVF